LKQGLDRAVARRFAEQILSDKRFGNATAPANAEKNTNGLSPRQAHSLEDFFEYLKHGSIGVKTEHRARQGKE
jgi:hypothetical protein